MYNACYYLGLDLFLDFQFLLFAVHTVIVEYNVIKIKKSRSNNYLTTIYYVN
jgi:hypothetical protein